MRPALVLLPVAGLVLAACEPDPRVTAEPEEVTVPAPEAPPPDPRRYIGRWAKSADLCATEWWRFWGDELLTKTVGLACDIAPPGADFSDETITTICRAGGRGVREEWRLSYAEEGARLTITDPEGEIVDLVRCD